MSNQPTPEQIALKPCPFCGAPLAVEKFTRTCQQAIHPINGCCLSDMKVFPMGNGYKQWNTRINEKLEAAAQKVVDCSARWSKTEKVPIEVMDELRIALAK